MITGHQQAHLFTRMEEYRFNVKLLQSQRATNFFYYIWIIQFLPDS